MKSVSGKVAELLLRLCYTSHHSSSGTHPAIRRPIKPNLRNSSNHGRAHRKEMECESHLALVAVNSDGSSIVTDSYTCMCPLLTVSIDITSSYETLGTVEHCPGTYPR